MAEEVWAKILHAVYQNEGRLQERVDNPETFHDDIASEAGISKDTLEAGCRFLERHGMVETDNGTPVLTEKGFDVARQRDMQLSQFETNIFLAVFTFLLSLAIVAQTLYKLYTAGLIGVTIGALLIAAVVLLFGLLERRTRLFRLLIDGR